jgi:hypothetical protein
VRDSKYTLDIDFQTLEAAGAFALFLGLPRAVLMRFAIRFAVSCPVGFCEYLRDVSAEPLEVGAASLDAVVESVEGMQSVVPAEGAADLAPFRGLGRTAVFRAFLSAFRALLRSSNGS